MLKRILPFILVIALTGCAHNNMIREKILNSALEAPKVQKISSYLESQKLDPPADGPIPVAVYTFTDKTGQRKSSQTVASFSSAVTQGADAYLIKALQDVGDSKWFVVLERGGLDNLIKERQMIRQAREMYQGRDAKPLPPMLFAGVIFEGSITGYDSNTLTGGSGMRIFGIGASTQYQSDTVTVTLRTVSVSTGEVLTTVTTTKTVLSYLDKLGVLKFSTNGETAFESESGNSFNESVNQATDLAIQAAVVSTIHEGVKRGHWNFKK